MKAMFAALAGALLLPASGLTYAQDGEPGDDDEADRPFETVTVIGTRTERTLDELAATVSVIEAEDIEREVARDIADLVRYEPGVSVAGTGSRFGLGGFTIRGIGGNRVLTMIDGVRVPEEFSFGPFLSARRDFVDVDSLARAEIARGPISSLYGSDAIGGVVALTTKTPRDYLTDDRPFYGSAKGGYSSADESAVGTLTFAAGNDLVSGMVLYTTRDAQESDTHGSLNVNGPDRELADPQDITSDNIVAKLALHPGENHTFTLGLDYFDGQTDTQIRSDYGIQVFTTTIDRRDALDERERTRFSLNYRFESDGGGFADFVSATIYHQTSESAQRTQEDRTTIAQASQTRARDSFFDQDIDGAYLQLGKAFDVGNVEHYLTYGVDYYATDSISLRDGGTFDANGNALPEFTALPTRDFPPTEVEQFAVFLQDEISFMDGRLLLSPGLRYDNFDASAVADPVYLAGNPGTPLPADYDDSELTFRLGAVYAFSDAWSGYVQYAEGFRAPPYDDVNVGFTNPAGGYKTISNPDLESERSQGFELGLRTQGTLGSLSFGVFHTDYENFIESLATAPEFLPTGIDPDDGLFTFQSINREDVEIEGAELSGTLNLGEVSSALDSLTLRFAIAYAEGEDKGNDQPINSIEPLSGVLGISYRPASDRWGTELVWTVVDGKDESDIDGTVDRLATAGYGIVDILAFAQLTERVRVNGGLFNVTDKEYIRWADSAAIGNDSPLRFTQPGFNAGVNVLVEF